MASLDWLWRRVCTPNCTTACKRYCPGCRARAAEWAEREQEEVEFEEKAEQTTPGEKRSMGMRELARCAVDCLSADVKGFFGKRSKKKDEALLQIGADPRPVDAGDGAQGRQACGCRSSSDDEKDRAASRSAQ